MATTGGSRTTTGTVGVNTKAVAIGVQTEFGFHSKNSEAAAAWLRERRPLVRATQVATARAHLSTKVSESCRKYVFLLGLPTCGEARRIASNIAKLPDMLAKK